MNNKLDVFEILNEKKNTGKLDVFEILNAKQSQNQEHADAPDFDLSAAPQAPKPARPAAPAKPKAHVASAKPAAPAVPAKPKAQPAPQAPKPAKPVAPVKPKAPAAPAKAVAPAKPKTPAAPAKSAAPAKPKASVAPAEPAAPAVPAKPKAQPAPRPQPVPRPDKAPLKRRVFWTIIKAIAMAAAIILFLTFVVGCPKVSVDSMAPLISSGDRVVIKKNMKKYHIDDVIMFEDSEGRKYIARIVAKNGDMVSVTSKDGLIINNKAEQNDKITTITTVTDTAVQYPVLVSEGEFFVLGDNRTNSVDSRNSQIGEVQTSQITGKVLFCFKKIK